MVRKCGLGNSKIIIEYIPDRILNSEGVYLKLDGSRTVTYAPAIFKNNNLETFLMAIFSCLPFANFLTFPFWWQIDGIKF